jgi:hypothetical protein
LPAVSNETGFVKCFVYCVFRSDWWDAVPERYQRSLANRVMSGVDDDFSRTARSLLDDGVRALKSTVAAKHASY